MSSQQKKGLILFATIFLVGLGLCQASSYFVDEKIAQYQSVEILPFLQFTHIRNTGGVFGLLQGQGWIFAVFSVLFLGGLCVFVLRDKNLSVLEYVCSALIFSGGTSNILDRLIYGSVVDFIDVQGIPGWHYIFNTADTLIHVGIWPWFLYTFVAARRKRLLANTQAS